MIINNNLTAKNILSSIVSASLYCISTTSSATVVFADNFDNGLSKWNVHGGTWSTYNGELHADYPIGCGSIYCPQADLTLNNQSLASDSWKASVDFTRAQDITHPTYYQSYASFSTIDGNNNKLSIYIGGAGWNSWGGSQNNVIVNAQLWNGRWNQVFHQSVPMQWNPDEWHTASIFKDNNKYYASMDGKYLSTITDTWLGKVWNIGLHTYGTKRLDNYVLESGVADKIKSYKLPLARIFHK